MQVGRKTGDPEFIQVLLTAPVKAEDARTDSRSNAAHLPLEITKAIRAALEVDRVTGVKQPIQRRHGLHVIATEHLGPVLH
jgi:hypothetical protein